MCLPIFERPRQDELWQGYIMRLAMMNEYKSLDDFEHQHLYGSTRKKRSGVMFPESLSKICDRMSSVKGFPNVEEAIEMTPYYAAADALSEGKQAKLAESILYDINEPVTPNNRTHKKFYFDICPECQKEDMEKYGHWYFHLKHHLPGVQVCTKHKVPLIQGDRFDKRVSCMPKFEKWKAFLIDDMSAALAHAHAMEASYETNRNMFLNIICPDCGKKYITHPYSEQTGAGCPFCRNKTPWNEFVQQRLDILYKGEYSLSGVFSELTETEVTHLPCGLSKPNLEQLLWGKPGRCEGCRKLTPEKIQERIDPEKKEYLINRYFRNKSRNRTVNVTHLTCGHTYDIIAQDFMTRPHCVLCDRKQKIIDIRDVDKEYEIISEYQNNHDEITFKHLDCGCTFETSKTSFLAGMRCPICTNHYDYQMVAEVVAECTDEYKVKKGTKRGTVDLYHLGEKIAEKIPYTKIMNDLQAERSELIKKRIKKYIPPKSIRRTIYDAVKKSTQEKGFWEGKDGIDGQPYTRRERNILQDLANRGYIERIEKGRYRI